MTYSVIYSVDTPADVDPLDYAPPHAGDTWDETEDDNQFEYGYLEGCWENGHHRKWCAVLSRDQFDKFVDHTGLTADSCETMGSIGAPGFGYGWAPAISFSADAPDAIQNAYVTPIPDEADDTGVGQRDWKGVRDSVLAVYG